MFDFFNATAEQLEERGWMRWSNGDTLRLCPETDFPNVPDGIAMYSISGTVHVKGRDYIDDDTRGGILAYGLIPGHTTTTVSAASVAATSAQKRAEFVQMMTEVVQQNGIYDLSTGKHIQGQAAVDALLETVNAGRATPEA